MLKVGDTVEVKAGGEYLTGTVAKVEEDHIFHTAYRVDWTDGDYGWIIEGRDTILSVNGEEV
jgi:uncharacterized protein YodC (DUF2158 family)